MSPKDLATCLWALARLDYPASEELKMKLVIKVKEVLTNVSADESVLQDGLSDASPDNITDSSE